MTQAGRESFGSPIWGTFAKQAAFIAALLFLLFFAFAIYTYHPEDAGWFYSGSGPITQNSMGPVGAVMADLTSALFGSLFYSLPLIFSIVAYILWRNPHRMIPLNNAIMCSIGSILFLSFGSALCYLHTVGDPTLQYGTGGILGKTLGQILFLWIGYDGATLVSLALFVLAFTLLAQIHWIELMEFIGEKTAKGYVKVFVGDPKVKEAKAKEAKAKAKQDAENAKKKMNSQELEKPAIFRKKDSPPVVDDVVDLDEEERAASSLWQKFKSKFEKQEAPAPAKEPSKSMATSLHEHLEPSFSGLDDMALDGDSVSFKDTLFVDDGPEIKFDDVWDRKDRKPTVNAKVDNERKAPSLHRSEPSPKEAAPRTRDVFSARDDFADDRHVNGRNEFSMRDDFAADRDVSGHSEFSARDDFADDDMSAWDQPRRHTNESTSLNEPRFDSSRFDDSHLEQPPRLQTGRDDYSIPTSKPAVKTLSEAKSLARLDESSPDGRSQHAAYSLPDRNVLTPPKPKNGGYSEDELLDLSALLEQRLLDFGVKAEVVEVNPGPVITRFEIQPAPGVKVSRITNLAKDLARSLSVMSVRVVEVIAGKSTIGIEIPNQHRDTVYFSEVINTPLYDNATSPLTLSLGHDIAGEPVVVDLAKMPHVLVAGTTGSGKSVGVNAMILSMLLKSTPDEVRMIMVDPKMLELSIYEGIPHLLTPVITDMKDAANGLRWSVDEMERRYKLMSKLGVRNIAGYNKKVRDAAAAGTPLEDPLWQPEMAMFSEDGVARTVPHLEPLPYIVIVVDEFADMMMIVGKKVEELIARIAQKARAAGIHLILATQRPSVDVITGLIKANIPTRMAFQVSSKIDSRTILDQGGADQLLGQGDMLYLPAGLPTPIRVHGAFVSDEEVHAVVEEWKARGEPQYINDVTISVEDIASAGGGEDRDPLYDEAVQIVIETRKASISSIQRRLKIGYNRAANLVEAMESAGLVGPMGTNGQREILIPE